MGRPISGKHSIEAVVFSCVFERAFSRTSIEALMTLKETLKEKYPVFSTTNVVNVRFEHQKMASESSHAIAGVSLQKLHSETKKPDWTLRADANLINITCFSYDRWNIESTKALEDLTTVINLVADDQNPVTNLALQTVDRFVGGPTSEYKINKVFDTRSKYLTRQVKESGPLWHIYQGWFEKDPTTKKHLLNNLNLSTNETPQGVVTTIDHNLKYIFNPPSPATDLTDIDNISAIFQLLHDHNKEIVTDLITKKQCNAIKLCH